MESIAPLREVLRSGGVSDWQCYGYRTRMAQLSYQVVEVRIPRLRGQGFVPSFLEPGCRAIAQVEGWVTNALMAGLSRSEVIRLLELTTGCRRARGS